MSPSVGRHSASDDSPSVQRGLGSWSQSQAHVRIQYSIAVYVGLHRPRSVYLIIRTIQLVFLVNSIFLSQ